MIGAGSLGCEYLKEFALMRIGCSEQGMITVADDDMINVSNMSSQFLFHQENIGESKTRVAI